MADPTSPSDAEPDVEEDVDLAGAPTTGLPDPFANLPKPRRGYEIHGPDAVPEASPDDDRTPPPERDDPSESHDR